MTVTRALKIRTTAQLVTAIRATNCRIVEGERADSTDAVPADRDRMIEAMNEGRLWAVTVDTIGFETEPQTGGHNGTDEG